jgi:2,3,4,5-tetrahydropyridine-2-carboxylate N-succinyltransferase
MEQLNIFMTQDLIKIIETAFENRQNINISTTGEIREAVNHIANELDCGKIRVCEKINDKWQVNQWIKKAILLSFKLNDNYLSSTQNSIGDNIKFFDKVFKG